MTAQQANDIAKIAAKTFDERGYNNTLFKILNKISMAAVGSNGSAPCFFIRIDGVIHLKIEAELDKLGYKIAMNQHAGGGRFIDIYWI